MELLAVEQHAGYRDEQAPNRRLPFLAADVFVDGYAITGDRAWLDDHTRPCLDTAGRDPFYEGDRCRYHTSKELANTVPSGIVFLHFANGRSP